MKIDTELGHMVWRLIEDCRVGLLTTADSSGWPHATWMNFQVKGYLDEVFTITAPTTQKVDNLRENSRAEWLFSNPTFESVATVSGEMRIVEGDAVKPYWDAIPGKSHAYYRRYFETEDPRHFVVLSMKVAKVVFCRPAAYRKFTVLNDTTITHYAEIES